MSKSLDELVEIMARLRAPGGCPWDREQTHESIVPQLIEETYEVVSAIEDKNPNHLCEELGDLLLHVVFHAQLAKEEGAFDIEKIISGLVQKLIHRHPHVFGSEKVDSAAEVMKNWEELKASEKKNHKGESLLDSVPKSLPALYQAYKLSKKVSKVGFDWGKTDQVLEKLEEELDEVKQAAQNKDAQGLKEEMGDLLFTIANLCRFLGLEPEEALRESNLKFRKRFGAMENVLKQKKTDPKSLDAKAWDQLWNEVKK